MVHIKLAWSENMRQTLFDGERNVSVLLDSRVKSIEQGWKP